MQNYAESKKISACQELVEREGWIGRAQRILGQWNYTVWYYSGRYTSCCYTFVKTHRVHRIKNELQGKPLTFVNNGVSMYVDQF